MIAGLVVLGLVDLLKEHYRFPREYIVPQRICQKCLLLVLYMLQVCQLLEDIELMRFLCYYKTI